jgi:hypothetical protein
VFFDPGPRAFTFVREPERRQALDTILGRGRWILIGTASNAFWASYLKLNGIL